MFIPENGGVGVVCVCALRAITCFSGNYYCMKLVESFSAISVLAAVVK